MNHIISPCSLEEVIATGKLADRPDRRTDPGEETQALLSLTRSLSFSPRNFFGHLVKSTLKISGAGSAGISVLNESTGRFVWPAVAGMLKAYVGAGTPSDFGPCGTVLDRNTSLLFIHPERHFTYLAPIVPPLEEVLLIPFHVDGKAVGTIWAVSHEPARRFCLEDRRLLETLSTFASSAYSVLIRSESLQPLLDMQPESVS